MVGQKVVELLRDADERCVVIDQVERAGVDVVGNVFDTATLDRAGVRHASGGDRRVTDDGESVFATAAVRDYAPGVPLIVRVQRASNTSRLYRSGLTPPSRWARWPGQVLAYNLLDEQTIGPENRIKLARVVPGALVGAHPGTTTNRRPPGPRSSASSARAGCWWSSSAISASRASRCAVPVRLRAQPDRCQRQLARWCRGAARVGRAGDDRRYSDLICCGGKLSQVRQPGIARRSAGPRNPQAAQR